MVGFVLRLLVVCGCICYAFRLIVQDCAAFIMLFVIVDWRCGVLMFCGLSACFDLCGSGLIWCLGGNVRSCYIWFGVLFCVLFRFADGIVLCIYIAYF